MDSIDSKSFENLHTENQKMNPRFKSNLVLSHVFFCERSTFNPFWEQFIIFKLSNSFLQNSSYVFIELKYILKYF